MVSRSHVTCTGVRARTPAWFVLRVAHKALSVAVPVGSDIAVLLIVCGLGRAWHGRQLGCRRGCYAARGQHGPAPGPSGAWLIVSDSDDAARLAPKTRMSWMLAGRVSGHIHGHPAACPRWGGRTGPG